MNGKIGSQKSRRRIKVAPVTRAVRIALAASAAAFALVGPGTALAQSCVDDAGTTRCDGTFVTPIEISNAVDDVTVVVGGLDPTTTVSPDPGYTAISVYSAGDVSLDNQASGVYSAYSTAILASALGSVAVDNSGYVSAYEGMGINAYSQDGDVTVVNSGGIESDTSSATTAAGIVAYSGTGQVSTSNSGSIDASGYDLAGGVVSYAVDGNASASNTGDIDVDSYYGTATGVYAYSLNGDASVSNDGHIEASSGYGIADGMFASGAHVTASNGESGYAVAYGYTWAAGIEIHGNDSAQATNAGVAVGVSYYDGAHGNGIYAAGGEGGVSVQNDGLSEGVSVGYGFGTGISAVATGGDIDIVNNGDAVGIAFGGYATGIQASGSYDGTDITIVNDGTAYAYVRDDIGLATGIEATATGNVDIANTGTVSAYADAGFTTGIHAESTYPGGDAVVTNSGAIYAQGYYGGTGIEAMAVGAGGSASASNSEYILATQGQVFGYGAYGMVASGDLDATVDNSGYIEAQSGGSAYGAVALATNGVAAASNSGGIDVYGMGYNYTGAYGLVASSANGSAEVDNSGTIEVASLYYGHGISASGTAGSTVTNSGDVVSDAWNSYGILATAGTGDAIVTNTVDGTVTSIYTPAYYSATVFGIVGISTAGDVAIRNDGSVYAGAAGRAFGLAGVASAGNADIVNTGTVEVDTYGNTAIGALVRAEYGTASFDNSGDMQVDADYGYAYGVQVVGASVQAVNTGSIDVDGDYAFGMFAVGTDVSVTNDGDIQVVADYDVAKGIYANGYVDASSPDGNVSVATGAGSHIAVDNAGSGFALGIQASSGAGDIAITSAGAIDVNANGLAFGIYAETGGDITIANTGDVTVESAGRALGILAYSSYGTITASNGGAVVAHSDGPAFGMWGWAYAGAVSLVNAEGGSIDVESTGSDPTAGMYAVGADVSATNDGDIQVVTDNRDAWGIYAHGYANASYDGNISVTTGAGSQIVAHSTGSSAYGIYAYSGVGDIAIDNAGAIEANAYHAGIGVSARSEGDVAINSTGAISAGGTYAATGIYAGSWHGAATASNGGTITARSDGQAQGMAAFSGDGTVMLENMSGGSIEVESANDMASGMYVRAYDPDVTLVNAGAIDAYSHYGVAAGLYAATSGDIDISSTGDITVDGASEARGISGRAFGDTINASNDGAVSVRSDNQAIGIWAQSGTAAITMENAEGGSIDVDSAGGIAIGMYSSGFDPYSTGEATNADLVNAGSIEAYSHYGPAAGIVAASPTGALSVVNSGSLEASSAQYFGVGITVQGDTASVINSGHITADGYAGAEGAMAIGVNGATLDNSGDIAATSVYGSSYGAMVSSKYGDVSATNSGTIDAHSDSSYAAGLTVHAQGSYYGDINGDATVTNSGAVSASAGYGTAVGIDALGLSVMVSNAGSATAIAEDGDAYGIMAYGDAVEINSAGDAGAEATGTAIGINTYGNESVAVASGGAIQAISSAGEAFGIQAGSLGDATVSSSGDISASAASGTASGIDVVGLSVHVSNAGSATGIAADGNAYGITAFGDTVEINSAGDAGAEATGTAVGINAYGNESVAVTNSGTIHAVSGADGEAFGVLISGPGDASVTNSGTITASHPDSAVAVQFDSTGTATLANSGTIGVDSASEGAIIASIADGAGALGIANTGTMTGAIVTYAGDDSLANGQGGMWNVTNHATDFGAGDDAIRNAAGGAIALSNGAIRLGSSTEAGNSFVNEGLLSVSGENLIDMGTGVDIAPAGIISAMSFSPMAAPNPAAFMNDGIIDFVDGSPDDTLTIAGDFGGVGAINLDVNLVNGSSDLLYIDGDVVDGTEQTVNLAVEGVASVDQAPTPFLTVTGSVAEGAFTLGEVTGLGSGNFLDMTLGLSEATDGDATVFSFNAKVNGLNRTGVLAANMAPGAQALIASAIGTMRQRVGAQANASDYGMGPWVRFFDNSGDVDPAHTQDFGTAGDFRFEQMNRGLEFGMGFDFDGPVGFGIMFGNADAKQKMNDGSGSDHLEMSSVGVYGTWTVPEFYVDLSFRWMDLDATLMSSAGETRGSGNATASNIEAGYTGWNMGGFDIVPQAQYTRSTVDIDPLDGTEVSFESGQNDSSRGRLGVEIARSFDAAGFSWRPYAAASIVREFDGDGSYTIADAYSGTTSIEGTSTLLEAGIGTRIGGFSGTFGVNWSDGGALDSQLGGNLVLRYTW